MSFRYDIIRFIGASVAFETILDKFSSEDDLILNKNEFSTMRKKLSFILKETINRKN